MKIQVITVLAIVGLCNSADAQPINHTDHGESDLCDLYSATRPTPLLKSQVEGQWSDPATWGGRIPSINDDVLVQHTITADSGQAREIQIRGQLVLAGTLNSNGSVLVCSGGTLSGIEGTLNFHVEDDRDFAGNSTAGPISANPDFHPDDNGLWVLDGGTLDLNGPKVTSWVNAESKDNRFRKYQHGTSSSVAFGDGKAKLFEEPEGWRAGDQLLLVTEKGEHTLATLSDISGTSITYEAVTELSGSVLSIEGNFIRPKIANLSRRLQIIGADVSEEETHHRAHTAYMKGSQISIKSVEFRNLGPREKLGRYPIHWHHAMATQDILQGSSIWQSVDDGGNRFVTMHMVSGATVSDNVGFRAQGHGFFMEELMEFDNVIKGNLSVDVRYGEELPNFDEAISRRTHHYWLRESNEISGNVAAGNNWDVEKYGNRFPSIDGLVVLPSSKRDPNPLVSDFECLGCGGIGMWTAVPNTTFENPVSTQAIIAGYSTYTESQSGIDNGGAAIINPLFLINGNNDTFSETRDYSHRLAWASQIYANYSDVKILGGVLAGNVGIHAHYHPRVSITETSIYGNVFIEPTYWDMTTMVYNAKIYSDSLFYKPYPTIKQASPGIAVFSNTCFGKACEKPDQAQNFAVTRDKFSDLFNINTKQNIENATIISDQVPDSGFIRIPKEFNARYWSITRAGSLNVPEILYITESENEWNSNLNDYGGYLNGYPPGDYKIKLFGAANAESLIAELAVTVKEGEVSVLCFDRSSCLD